MDPTTIGLPASVPLYPDSFDFTGKPGLMLVFMTEDPPDMVSDFYRLKLPARGWSLLNELPDKNQTWQNESQIINLTFNPRGKGTQVVIAIIKSP